MPVTHVSHLNHLQEDAPPKGVGLLPHSIWKHLPMRERSLVASMGMVQRAIPPRRFPNRLRRVLYRETKRQWRREPPRWSDVVPPPQRLLTTPQFHVVTSFDLYPPIWMVSWAAWWRWRRLFCLDGVWLVRMRRRIGCSCQIGRCICERGGRGQFG